MSGSSKILLGFILGGMMSVDMGGPFNKAAYVFGTASIAAGNYDIMAAVMIGGIFVFPVVGNAMMYLVALVIGTIVSTALLGLLKNMMLYANIGSTGDPAMV